MNRKAGRPPKGTVVLHYCDCGSRAYVHQGSGWVCQTCLDIDNKRARAERKLKTGSLSRSLTGTRPGWTLQGLDVHPWPMIGGVM